MMGTARERPAAAGLAPVGHITEVLISSSAIWLMSQFWCYLQKVVKNQDGEKIGAKTRDKFCYFTKVPLCFCVDWTIAVRGRGAARGGAGGVRIAIHFR